MIFANRPTRIPHSTLFSSTPDCLPPQGERTCPVKWDKKSAEIKFPTEHKVLIHQFIEEFNRVKVRNKRSSL